MKLSTKAFSIACLLALGLMTAPLTGQNAAVQTYPDFQPTQEYYAAMELIREAGSARQQGINALLQLSQQNPRTTLGATCLFSAAMYGERKSVSIPIYQRIVAEYPNSGFELQARFALMSLQSTTTESWFLGSDSLLRSYGAPTLAEVKQNQGQAVAKLRGLPLDYQHGLTEIYRQMKVSLQSPNIRRYSDALLLSYFGREAFAYDQASASSFSSGISYNADRLTGELNPTTLIVAPKVTVRSPKGGKVGPLPRLRFETTLRNSRVAGVSSSDAQFFLDGVNVSKQVQVLSFRVNPTAKKHQIYEQLLFGFQPTQPLVPGAHQFSMIIPTLGDQINPVIVGPGVVRKTISFSVRQVERDCDDDKDNDHWEDND
jgi:hypothetical protein